MIRSALVASLLGLTLTAPPGHAGISAAAVQGNMHIACFGCGVPSPGQFEGSAQGVVDGEQMLGPFSADFLVDGDIEPCQGVVQVEIVGSITFGTVGGWKHGTFGGTLIATAEIDRDDVAVDVNMVFAHVTVVFESGATALMELDFVLPGFECWSPMDASLFGALGSASATLGCVVGPCVTDRANVVAFEGAWHEDCFGCDMPAPGNAALTVTSAGTTYVEVGSPATATFVAAESSGVLCLVTGSAYGTISGAIDLYFNWTRLGAFAVLTVGGDFVGTGTGTFFTTATVCGGPIDAHVTAQLAGV